MFMSELAAEPLLWLILAGVAFLAGFIDAIAGGGGLLTIPALLSTGLPPHLVLGTNKLCATFGSATASLTFVRRRLFEPKRWRTGLLATLCGAALGALLAHQLPARWLNQVLPLIVFACGLYMLLAPTPQAKGSQESAPRRFWQVPQGLTLGFYDGVAGPGTGAFWTVSTLLLHRLDLLRASGVARTMNFVSNATALTVFALHGQVDWLLGIAMGVALMVGAFLGARTAIGGGAKLIRPIVILTVLALTLRLVWQHWLG